jgi:hypothetical protein
MKLRFTHDPRCLGGRIAPVLYLDWRRGSAHLKRVESKDEAPCDGTVVALPVSRHDRIGNVREWVKTISQDAATIAYNTGENPDGSVYWTPDALTVVRKLMIRADQRKRHFDGVDFGPCPLCQSELDPRTALCPRCESRGI